MSDHVIRLETRGLSVGYDGAPVVETVDLTVRAGEILALIGPNGAGKSTLLKSIAGQLSPVAGTVLLQGKDMREIPVSETSKQMSLLLTGKPSAELMSCREVVAAGRYPYTGRLGILSQGDWEIVDRAMARMDAAALADRPFDSISDGQRQRVLLARALCQEPEVLVLDEPASFLDVRYQLELVRALRSLADEEHLSVIVSLHELDLVRRCGDQALCLKDGRVDLLAPVEEVFSGDYLERLYDLPPGSLTEDRSVDFRHYIHSDGKRLRCGYTTGTCAALAASGAARRLLTGVWPETVSLVTPKGITVQVPLEETEAGENYARCAVRKDAGDDVDCTAGILVAADVRRGAEPGVLIRGGEGVGRVTTPGLDQSVGEAAINSTPRRMIRETVETVMQAADEPGGLEVTISVPGGEELAKKTFNPDLGIVGGISILGTSGIVEPMSRQALVDTICLELRQRFAEGYRKVILTPGNYGMEYIRTQKLDTIGIPVVKCSNYIGEALDEISLLGFEQILLVGHIGKLVKLAGGIMNTHSRQADCRLELLTAHAALCGASRELSEALMNCATTDACVGLLRDSGMLEPVMSSIGAAVQRHLSRRAGEACRIGAVLFSNESGLLGETETAKELLEEWNTHRSMF